MTAKHEKQNAGKEQELSGVPGAKKIRALLAGGARSFASDDEILDYVYAVFCLRSRLGRLDKKDARSLAQLERQASSLLHESFRLTHGTHIADSLAKYRLCRFERDIFLALLLRDLGMFPRNPRAASAERLQSLSVLVGCGERGTLQLARAVARGGRLRASGLIAVRDGNDSPLDCDVQVSRRFLEPLVIGKRMEGPWKVRTPADFLRKCYDLIKMLSDRSEQISAIRNIGLDHAEVKALNRNIILQLARFRTTLRPRVSWPLHALSQIEDDSHLTIVLVLLGKEMGFFNPQDDIFTGDGLARAASSHIAETPALLKILMRSAPLCSENIIRVCGGPSDSPAYDDESTLKSCEFELTPQYLERIEVKRQRKGPSGIRSPLLGLKQLVLPESVLRALNMALAQSRYSRVMLDDWGLGNVITYGRATTLLFYGPPGVGKTAAAEALAHELQRRILVVNYAEMQSCWVGQTEKNIMRAFRDAVDSEAVLFWDEADAMFYSRDAATRTFEVRDVNVLLQELERFQGVCILATNRACSLDPALERRIAVKVEFSRPDAASRARIWRQLVPRKMPIEKGVSFDHLAQVDLSGGQIKNAVLNAARIALCRDAKGMVTMADLAEAIRMESEGSWGTGKKRKIGFEAN